MSVAIWVMIGLAFWHFTVLVPQRFYGGIVGALFAAVAGALASGYALPQPGVPSENPPGIASAVWAVPGALLALAGSYFWGVRRQPEHG